MNRASSSVLYLWLVVFCSGCARFPDSPPATGKQIVLTLKVRGKVTLTDPVNPSTRHYYFIAIDNDNDQYTGPWAVAFPPYGGNGWVTSRDADRSLGATSFIEYSAANPAGYIYAFVPGSFLLQYTNPQPPVRLDILEGGSTLRVTIDLRQVATSSIPAERISELDINFITTNELAINPNQTYPNRQFDGLGPSGQDYVTIDTTVDKIYQGQDEDLVSPTDPDLDIVYWSVEVQTVSSR
ncbi:MAG: hypothetical protein QHI38_10010 [Armatimonadota bacterium]|nr:hypothetical protein [Armatimonadota bacterium]